MESLSTSTYVPDVSGFRAYYNETTSEVTYEPIEKGPKEDVRRYYRGRWYELTLKYDGASRKMLQTPEFKVIPRPQPDQLPKKITKQKNRPKARKLLNGSRSGPRYLSELRETLRREGINISTQEGLSLRSGARVQPEQLPQETDCAPFIARRRRVLKKSDETLRRLGIDPCILTTTEAGISLRSGARVVSEQ